ncbi:hypothetical protein CHCC14814_1149 [Bacillus paralicheniformis]|nr:hypothetical protein CHCC14814_1149 [Bacillus paralicheniformis]
MKTISRVLTAFKTDGDNLSAEKPHFLEAIGTFSSKIWCFQLKNTLQGSA